MIKLSFDRMISYLPTYWQDYTEMKLILENEGAEVDKLDEYSQRILTDAFILEMSESRTREWEKWLGLPPTGTLDERRLAILNYFAVVAKLSRDAIKVLVYQLYKGARATVIFEDSTIKITIKPLPEHENETIDFTVLLTILERRKPCHISLFSERYRSTWGELAIGFDTWQDVNAGRDSWQAVYDFILE